MIPTPHRRFRPPRLVRSFSLAVLLLLSASSLVYAVGNPGYLAENVSDIPAGSKTYRVWYTTDCDGAAGCDCDTALDLDSDENGTLDTDSPNSCIATADSGVDGIFDTGPDDDGDGNLNVMDLDWSGSGTGVVESVPRNLQRTVNQYVNNLGFREPAWDTDTNRGAYVYDIDAFGYANTNGNDYDTSWMLTQGPEPRGTVLHELWHNTQFAYGASAGNWLIEGQARSMQDKVYDDLDNRAASRYHNSVNAYLGNTTWAISEDRNDDGTEEFDQAAGLLGASYDASLWWTYVVDQAGNQFVGTASEGIDALKAVLEQSADFGRQGIDATDRVLRDRIGQGWDDTFWDFTVANYAKDFDLNNLPAEKLGGRDPNVVLKYSDEDRTPPTTLIYGPVERQTFNNLFADPSGSVEAARVDVSDANAMPAYGVNYYEGLLGTAGATACPLAYWRVDGEPGTDFMHSFLVLQADSNGDGVEEVVDLLRSSGPDFARAIWTGRKASGAPGVANYTRIVGVVATGDRAGGYDWELSCTQPSLDIVDPVTADPAYVGEPSDPGRFMVWLNVTGGSGSSTYVAGLDWQRDFTVTVGTQDATILNGGYVQNQYWLLVQAPPQPGASVGDKFDLNVRLGPDGFVTDTTSQSVVYSIRSTDQVLVVDRSGSMADFNKMESAKTAARLYAEAVNRFDRLGAVSFSTTANALYTDAGAPYLITDQDDSSNVRANARTAINTLAPDAATGIGGGLQLGQTILNTVAPVDRNPERAMVLLSDGIENTAPFWSAVRAGIVADAIKVHAIALGQDADEELMRDIAERTCGDVWVDQCYDYIEESGVAALASASPAAVGGLPNALADSYLRAREFFGNQQRLWQDSGTQAGGSSRAINVVIGEDGVRNAVFSFNWSDPAAPLNVSISGPSPVVARPSDSTHKVFYADKLMPGTYVVNISAPAGASAWIGSLAGRLISGTEMHAFIDTITNLRRPGLPIALQVSLTDKGGPLKGAKVVALVRHPEGDVKQITLVDDGGIYDDIANDGIYGFVYDRINRPLVVNNPLVGHSWVFDIVATGKNNEGKEIARYDRLTFTPFLARDQKPLDLDNDGMLDRWEDRFDAADSSVPDGDKDPDQDGLTNKQEHELGLNPDDPDSDRGGEIDGSEVTGGRDPLLAKDDILPKLTDVWAENLPGKVVLHFNPHPEYQKIRIFRSNVPNGPFILIGTLTPEAGGKVSDNGLVNNQDYYYRLQAVGASSVTGRPSAVFRGEPALDPFQPEGDVLINDDAPTTSSTNVTLRFEGLVGPDGLNARFVKISNTPDLSAAPWQTLALTMPWTIAPDPVTKQAFVYVRFRDKAGNVSDVIYGDGIIFRPKLVFPGSLVDLLNLKLKLSAFAAYSFTLDLLPYPSVDPVVRPLKRTAQLAQAEPNPKLRYGDLAFVLSGQNAGGSAVRQLDGEYELLVSYEDWQWKGGGVTDEATLKLYRLVNGRWQPLPGTLDQAANTLTVRTRELGEFALLGEARQRGHLPVVLR